MIPETRIEPENMEDEDEGYMHEESELTLTLCIQFLHDTNRKTSNLRKTWSDIA